MAKFFKRAGSELIERMSEERTGKPNIWWSPEQLTSHGFVECQPDQAALKELAVSSFNSKSFFGRLIQEFDAARWLALSKLGVGWTMQQLVDYPNFEGLKAYANGLLSDGTITLEDAGKINACLLEQGINLENY